MTEETVELSLPSGERRRVPLSEALAGAHDLIARGRPDLGEALCQQILGAVANQFDATLLLGIAQVRQNQLEPAVLTLLRACEINPESADAWNNLAYVRIEAGQFEEAVHACQRAVEQEPSLAPAHNNLGSALMHLGQITEAVVAYRQAIATAPDYAAAHANLAEALKQSGDMTGAQKHAQKAAELSPTDPDALLQLASLHDSQQRIDEAVAVYRSAIRVAPERADLHHNLGLLLERKGQWLDAVACHEKALSLEPDNIPALSNLAFLSGNLCLWQHYDENLARYEAAIDNGARGLSPLTYLAMADDPERQQQCARVWARHVEQNVAKLDVSTSPVKMDATRIRVGYLSADFHEHPTARLMAGLFEQHDHDRFHLTAYSIGRDDGSELRQRVQDAFDDFHDLRTASDQRIAEQVRRDGIQILVDLKGYTGEARSEIMALRPAPLQMQYLGYPGTMGATFIDYAIVDEYCVPEDQSRYFDEKLIRLPGSYQVNDSQRETPSQFPSRADCGLPEEGTIFCCFNKPFKITPEIFQRWCQILENTPGSVLWLLAPREGLGIEQRLREQAERHGVDASRLIFASRRPYLEYLALFANADLFLDTTPYSAHTMASDALWMGCPVLAIEGRCFAARVAAGLVRYSGLEALVASDLDDYQRLAVELGSQQQQLADLRKRITAERGESPVFDTARFTHYLESGYLAAKTRLDNNEPPAHITITAN